MVIRVSMGRSITKIVFFTLIVGGFLFTAGCLSLGESTESTTAYSGEYTVNSFDTQVSNQLADVLTLSVDDFGIKGRVVYVKGTVRYVGPPRGEVELDNNAYIELFVEREQGVGTVDITSSFRVKGGTIRVLPNDDGGRKVYYTKGEEYLSGSLGGSELSYPATYDFYVTAPVPSRSDAFYVK